ncbi:TadE/TadG family type IV pilus assembly protein [Cupriavidus sp. L7L]|uniref:TadE/TadG family type IV pilus assembly protein n=1 Tax=Cupriavidus sp. L7L TaxID=2546443 RepID=UPI0010563599|nr:TadE/TadG family type IV pilus assembly protein [Cupriavidus sp. L7L]TDF66194.1 pilus assembly protein [Cupriavidus sp. L7L]
MKKRQKGVALVELGITISLLLAICFAVTEFGRAIYTYNTLAKSVRDASRYLSTQAAGSTTAHSMAKQLVVYGTPVAVENQPTLAPGLKTSMVTICDAANPACTSNMGQGSNPAINTVTVRISGYTFTPILDLLGFTRFYTGGSDTLTSIPFSDISATMRQAYE